MSHVCYAYALYAWLRNMATFGGEDSHPSTSKRHRIDKRQFFTSWKKEFPWVAYHLKEDIRHQYCIDAEKNNVFTKVCDKLKDALTKHVLTVDHKAAIQAKSCRRDMQRALTHSCRDQELAIIAALKVCTS